MGMFDLVIVEYPLLIPSASTVQEWQTKSFECALETYRITAKGYLQREIFHWSQRKKARGLAKLKRKHVAWEDVLFTGSMEFYGEDDATGAWFDNNAKFKAGKLVLMKSVKSEKFGEDPIPGEISVAPDAAKSPDDLLGETEGQMSTRRVLKYGVDDEGNHFELYEETFVDEDKVTLEVKGCYFETVAADASRNLGNRVRLQISKSMARKLGLIKAEKAPRTIYTDCGIEPCEVLTEFATLDEFLACPDKAVPTLQKRVDKITPGKQVSKSVNKSRNLSES